MRTFVLICLVLFTSHLTAQTLLDAATHPKFQNALPTPTKVHLSTSGTNTLEMGQKTQWLGLVNVKSSNAKLNTSVWSYGTSASALSYPGPTLMTNSNASVKVEWLNNLPSKYLILQDNSLHTANPVSGIPTVVHLHGAHVEAMSDGHPEAWYTQGYASKGPNFVKPVYTYDNTQEATTLWYHDHTLGKTRTNVYAGLAGMYIISDDNEKNLINNKSLPHSNYDIEMMVQDRQFDAAGQLFYPTAPTTPTSPNPSALPEFFGDFILVNGMAWPYKNVEPRKYRCRLLNASDSRVYIFKLSNGGSFLQISTDGGKLNKPVLKTTLTMGPGERADIILDFSTLKGQNIQILNEGTDGPFGNPGSVPADPATTGKIMEFRVNQPLNTAIPEATTSVSTSLRPTAIPAMGTEQKTRKVALFEGTDDLGRIQPMLGIVDPANALNGSLTWHDGITENVKLNDTELWEIYNTTADAHPIHLHLISFQVLSRQTFTGTTTPKPQLLHNGKIGEGVVLSHIQLTGTRTNYAPNDNGWKDTYIIFPGEVLRLKAKFDRSGEYVWHCHILSHEDHDMMRKLVVGGACVDDLTPPVFTKCPTDMTVKSNTSCATVSWATPTASDNCAPSVNITQTAGLKSGSCFPLGTTAISYMGMDAKNNMGICAFKVNVIDSRPCVALANTATTRYFINNIWYTGNSVTVNAGKSLQISAFPTGMASYQWTGPNGFSKLRYNNGDVAVSDIMTAKEDGVYTVVIKENSGCTVSKSITVKVIKNCNDDDSPPVFVNCPKTIDIPIGLTNLCKEVSWLTPAATDNCSTPSVKQELGKNKGDCFNPGLHTVTYSAQNAKGKKATCIFTINCHKSFAGFLESSQSLILDAFAESNRSRIEWVNNTGNINDYFVIQKLNAQTGEYMDLQIVNKINDTTTMERYIAYDNTPNLGDNFYRIKLLFLDGSITYTDAKKVVFDNVSNLHIFPNPTESELNIDLREYKNNTGVELYIYNYLGQVILSKSIHHVSDEPLKLDVLEQETGQYLIRIVAKGKRDVTKSFIISH
jgi:spore coat protein A, manganese oxidase